MLQIGSVTLYTLLDRQQQDLRVLSEELKRDMALTDKLEPSRSRILELRELERWRQACELYARRQAHGRERQASSRQL